MYLAEVQATVMCILFWSHSAIYWYTLDVQAVLCFLRVDVITAVNTHLLWLLEKCSSVVICFRQQIVSCSWYVVHFLYKYEWTNTCKDIKCTFMWIAHPVCIIVNERNIHMSAFTKAANDNIWYYLKTKTAIKSQKRTYLASELQNKGSFEDKNPLTYLWRIV